MALGLFATAKPDSSLSSASTAATAHPPDSTNPDNKSILLAHIVSTKCDSVVVTDESMDFPPDWRQSVSEHDRRGHQEKGRTIALHSLGVLPAYQRMGLGRTVLKSYIQRMETAGVADRIALIAHGHLVEYYESFGFVNKGESAAQFGGGGWNDMVDSAHVIPQSMILTLLRSTNLPTLALVVRAYLSDENNAVSRVRSKVRCPQTLAG